MKADKHFTALENMYKTAPINKFYKPRIIVSEGHSEIEIDLTDKYYHAAGAVHGSVYFKMLDDAAFFAANSYEREVFVLTTTFTIYLTKPVTSGIMKAVGDVVNTTKSQFIAESIVYNSESTEVARGSGVFVRSKCKLSEALGYDA